MVALQGYIQCLFFQAGEGENPALPAASCPAAPKCDSCPGRERPCSTASGHHLSSHRGTQDVQCRFCQVASEKVNGTLEKGNALLHAGQEEQPAPSCTLGTEGPGAAPLLCIFLGVRQKGMRVSKERGLKCSLILRARGGKWSLHGLSPVCGFLSYFCVLQSEKQK